MLVICRIGIAVGFLNISFNRIIRHVIGFRLRDYVTQPAVISRIGASAFLDRYRKFLSKLRKYLPFCRVVLLFLMLDIGKF